MCACVPWEALLSGERVKLFRLESCTLRPKSIEAEVCRSAYARLA